MILGKQICLILLGDYVHKIGGIQVYLSGIQLRCVYNRRCPPSAKVMDIMIQYITEGMIV